ncbi:cyclic AMP-dependent transcription factor ATF-7 [Malaya genurostris]|uniref:cyclic AMP-dependent transcription factor ATF-7 n=1 Tax=Malaya genurostris TaxID=325434 RepID=UPI0026F3E5BC|nr:cyclic AMP-dependent transcription factor ATF-7 [Malaya genurostris]XP_058452249.1 cyclic AMP-dependent transcription factor ATF-7 [Malaya genurostris]XP_058452250.1 cyclic AMP-dependent transcription factor ATF-7 [Malaya genurostris]
MDTTEKPFPCKIDGCKLSFATEDHLIVHLKNHDLLLKLEIPNKPNLFTDQTPTPTRLIGKCEEVGLFEDLQNVNPFEETFRRAVEEKNSKSEDGPKEKLPNTVSSDDTLHTPHIFPLLERRESIKLSKLIISRNNSKRDEPPSVNENQLACLPVQSSDIVISTSTKRHLQYENTVAKKVKSLIKILPKTTPPVPVQTSVIIIPCNTRNNTTASLKPSNTSSSVKAKLKEHLNKANSEDSSERAVTQATEHPTSNTIIHNIESTIPTKDVKNDKLQKHERWKAAAKRYRSRVKQNQDILHRRNIELAEENHHLKTEILRLRNALALHRNCPVTKALTVDGSARLVRLNLPHKQA